MARFNSLETLFRQNLQPMALIGAGFSYPELETAHTLAKRLGDDAVVACEHDTAGSTKPCLACSSQLFLQRLQVKEDGIHSKYILTERLKLSAPAWNGDADLPLGRNSPRHRALARLAYEGLIHTIVCLNWDRFLEAAFDAIGLSEGAASFPVGEHIRGYTVVVDDEHRQADDPKVFRLVKPHGCVRHLRRRRRAAPSEEPIFKITHEDLNAMDQWVKHTSEADCTGRNPSVCAEVRLGWESRSLVACGWSAGEGYLQSLADQIKPTWNELPHPRLAVVDIALNERHDEFARFYQAQEGWRCQVDQNGRGERGNTTDNLWLDLYAAFALHQLEAFAQKSHQTAFSELLEMHESSDSDAWVLVRHFFDSFLPSWCRLCWRQGAIPWFDAKHVRINPARIPIGPRDWYIPFRSNVSKNPDHRPDLQAAANLLGALLKGPASAWRCDVFAGALWCETRPETLLLPVPGFLKPDQAMDLSSFKPLIEDWRRSGRFSRIREIKLLPLPAVGSLDAPVRMRAGNQASAALRHILPLPSHLLGSRDRFEGFEIVDLADLSTGGFP